MLNFYPGPSKLYPQVRTYLAEAYDSGILSMNHRSKAFVSLAESVTFLLKQKLMIPQDYCIYFISSATEAWEIIAQSLSKRGSLHIFNGAFGKKWAEYSQKIHQQATFISLDSQENGLAYLTQANLATSKVVCLTQNETSNGTQLNTEFMYQARQWQQEGLIAVDATSSMAGIQLAWHCADIWFASVQKCFGLPAGLGLLICSPSAIEVAKTIADNRYYNSLLFLEENREKFQTNYTPNVLNIYLLNRILQHLPSITEIDEQTKQRSQQWYHFLENQGFDLLVKNPAMRSDTVITVGGSEVFIKNIKEKASQQGIILGNGYGAWKENTFRIANFPAMSAEEIHTLQNFLRANRP